MAGSCCLRHSLLLPASPSSHALTRCSFAFHSLCGDLLHGDMLRKLCLSVAEPTVGAAKRKHHTLPCTATARGFSTLESKVGDADSKVTEADRGTIFVAGANGNTGKRIVKDLLSKGFKVRAGVLDIDKARKSIPKNDAVEFVLADVTESPDRLANAIGNADAVICATGYRRSFDLLAPWKVDNLGTIHLVDASRKKGVKRFILVSSILVNGAAIGQAFNPAYVILNLLGLTLIAKLQAENYIRKSGINYTIVRPGGLKNDPPTSNLVVAPEDTLFEGSISRDLVAQVAVEALLHPEASYKVVEIIEQQTAPAKSFQELFASIPSS